MKQFTHTVRLFALLAVLISALFAGSALADNGITASGERYTDAKGNDLKTVSVQFMGIPSQYEGWQATLTQTTPVCGVVINGVVNCEFRHEDRVKGTWLHLYKGTDQVASFYISFFVPGMKITEIIKEDPCLEFQKQSAVCISECCPQ